jgi:hypothetical protein
MTPEDRTFIQGHCYRVESPCGRAWDVPMRRVMNDYIAFLIENDGVTRRQALETMDASQVESWFHEQYEWQDVERDGRLVQQPTAQQIIDALDVARGGRSNMTSSVVDVPDYETRKKRRKLGQMARRGAMTPPKPKF